MANSKKKKAKIPNENLVALPKISLLHYIWFQKARELRKKNSASSIDLIKRCSIAHTLLVTGCLALLATSFAWGEDRIDLAGKAIDNLIEVNQAVNLVANNSQDVIFEELASIGSVFKNAKPSPNSSVHVILDKPVKAEVEVSGIPSVLLKHDKGIETVVLNFSNDPTFKDFKRMCRTLLKFEILTLDGIDKRSKRIVNKMEKEAVKPEQIKLNGPYYVSQFQGLDIRTVSAEPTQNKVLPKEVGYTKSFSFDFDGKTIYINGNYKKQQISALGLFLSQAKTKMDENSFIRNIDQVSKTIKDSSDMNLTLSELSDKLVRLSSLADEKVKLKLFGSEIIETREHIAWTGLLIIGALQLYLLIHVLELTGNVDKAFFKNDMPWIGLYRNVGAKSLSDLSIICFPIFLTNIYCTGLGQFPSSNPFQIYQTIANHPTENIVTLLLILPSHALSILIWKSIQNIRKSDKRKRIPIAKDLLIPTFNFNTTQK